LLHGYIAYFYILYIYISAKVTTPKTKGRGRRSLQVKLPRIDAKVEPEKTPQRGRKRSRLSSPETMDTSPKRYSVANTTSSGRPTRKSRTRFNLKDLDQDWEETVKDEIVFEDKTPAKISKPAKTPAKVGAKSPKINKISETPTDYNSADVAKIESLNTDDIDDNEGAVDYVSDGDEDDDFKDPVQGEEIETKPDVATINADMQFNPDGTMAENTPQKSEKRRTYDDGNNWFKR